MLCEGSTSSRRTTGAAKFAGALSTSGPLDTGGTVALFKEFQRLTSAQGTATTDGFIIGSVNAPDDGIIAFHTTIFGSSGGITMRATGGGTVSAVSPPKMYGAQASSMFILPVRKGTAWNVGIDPPYLQMTMPSILFYWIPLGVGSARASKEAPAPEDLAALPSAPAETPPGLPLQLSGQARLSEGRAIVQFLDAVTFASGNDADEQSYRVMLTPTQRCGWLAVTQKNRNSFVVEELTDEKSNASFDWFLMA